MTFHELLGTYGWAAAIVANLVIAWVGWSLRHHFVTREDHATALEEVARRHRDLVDKIEGAQRGACPAAERALRRAEDAAAEINSMPTRDEMHQLRLSVTELSGRIERLGERLDGQKDSMGRFQAVLDRVEDYLLKGTGR
jgi:hypothetical protein